ncbi:MAG TPA: ubiquinone/menaquinone biosynthesis methyltransferase [Gemmatimonadaceae bacterium]
MAATGVDVATARAAAAGGREKRDYVRRIFSEIAPRYDLLNHVLSLNVDRLWRRAAVHALGIDRNPGGTYLDLCAGTLDLAKAIAGSPAFRGRMLAVDFAEPMLRAGQRKLDGVAGGPVAADALQLPVADGTVAGAAVAFGIRNVADLDACAAEVLRVLEPRGRFVVLEFSTPRSPFIGSLYGFYFRRILPLVGGIVSGHPTAYRYLPESVAHFPEGGELAERLRLAGFERVEWRPLTFGIAALHVAQKGAARG